VLFRELFNSQILTKNYEKSPIFFFLVICSQKAILNDKSAKIKCFSEIFQQPEFDQNLKRNHQIFNCFLLAICSHKALLKVKSAKINCF
jgi:hypothetical protein